MHSKLKLIYVYDAFCSWCYGFSPVIQTIHDQYQHLFEFEVLSGGMNLGTFTGPVGVVYPHFREDSKAVEQKTGISFGEGFLRQLERGELIVDSERPAIALSVFKSFQPNKAISFIHDLNNHCFTKVESYIPRSFIAI
ncbi:hypothetical protein [Pedobacter sp. SYSU D00535]|uniref:hypothetical protein n=1 Tax=Pedobacter sp. SYSU D00535 TaxID=2810308 RepID=UPI001A96CEAE|nr:hypothetical protein [Pedobacter sp. SYSU D00535]